MKSTSKIFNYAKKVSKSGAVVNYTRPDLTRKWLYRVQQKAHDGLGQEASSKLSSLIDYFTSNNGNKVAEINWNYWKQNIRTEGIVDSLKSKNEELGTHEYNVDALAAKSAVTSTKYENYGLFLKYNYAIWMKQYTENLDNMFGAMSIGDPDLVPMQELLSYIPGERENAAGWRETGYTNTCKLLVYYFLFFSSHATL